MGEAEPDDDAEARRRRAERLRSEIEEASRGGRPRPATPREFTDRAAREAAESEEDDDDPG